MYILETLLGGLAWGLWGYLFSSSIIKANKYSRLELFGQFCVGLVVWFMLSFFFGIIESMPPYQVVAYAFSYAVGFWFWVRRFKPSRVPPND